MCLGRDDISDPVGDCKPEDLGKLVADVITYRSGTAKQFKGPFPGVKVKIYEGKSKKDTSKTTGEEGLSEVVDGLVPGSYSLELEPTADQKEIYDFANSPTTKTLDVKK